MWHLPFSYDLGLEVRKAAWVLFVAGWDSEEGLLKLTVAELLERHSSCDGGKDWDVCNPE